MIAGLRDVGGVQFVSSGDEVVVHNADGYAVVRDNVALILLGPPTPVDGTIHVGINGFVPCVGATWFTYVLAHEADGWVVTGTTGPAAIS